MMNAQARMLDAKFDPQLSTEDAFVAAAIQAYREATQGQRAVARTDHEGDGDDAVSSSSGTSLGDLTKRRGRDRVRRR